LDEKKILLLSRHTSTTAAVQLYCSTAAPEECDFGGRGCSWTKL